MKTTPLIMIFNKRRKKGRKSERKREEEKERKREREKEREREKVLVPVTSSPTNKPSLSLPRSWWGLVTIIPVRSKTRPSY